MTEEVQFVKLPIKDTFMQVLHIMLERYKYFLKFSIPLFVLIAFIFLLKDWLGLNKEATPFLPLFLLMIASMLIISMVIVAFHRTFIMDINDVEKTRIFRIGGREWRFIGWYFLISIFAMFIYMGYGLIIFLFGAFNNPEILRFIFPMLIIPTNYLFSRWLLVLPAASVDDEEASINFAWNLSEGNGWRLTLLIFAIPLLLNLIIGFIGSYELLVFNILSVILTIVSTIIGIGVISLSYSYLKINSNFA